MAENKLQQAVKYWRKKVTVNIKKKQPPSLHLTSISQLALLFQ